MASILVTGGAGFIGRNLVQQLIRDSDHKITIIDNLSNNNRTAVTAPTNKKITFYEEDIRNKETVSDIVKHEKIDTCIHLAAKISVNESIENPFETIDVNVMGTLCVLDACARNNIRNFVFASSAAVYGEPKVLPIPEDHILEPLSPYGASKVAGEALVTSYRNSGKIENCCALRFFNVYGEGQTPHYAGVITKFMERLSKGLPPIIYGTGKQTRDFIFVDDVIAAIILASESKKSGTYNIGTGKPVTINGLANKMIKIHNCDVKPAYASARKGDISDSYPNTIRSANILRFAASHTIESGMRILANKSEDC